MKTLRPSTFVLCLSAVAVLSAVVAHSAPAAKAPAAPWPVPQSVFDIPNKAGVARDPFNPARIIQAEAAKTQTATNAHPTSLGCLVLKGLSGAPSNPLAMINGRTMAPGEDAEINTADCGRLLVHCVDITTNSAIVEVGGERRELHLRSDF